MINLDKQLAELFKDIGNAPTGGVDADFTIRTLKEQLSDSFIKILSGHLLAEGWRKDTSQVMLSLTTETRRAYVVCLYNADDEMCAGPVESDSEQAAEEIAESLVSYNVHMHNEYFYAKIEKMIIPIYK